MWKIISIVLVFVNISLNVQAQATARTTGNFAGKILVYILLVAVAVFLVRRNKKHRNS